MNIKDEIDLRKKKNDEIEEIMTIFKFDKDKIKDNYNYLTKMPMDSVSLENIDKIVKDWKNKNHQGSLTLTRYQTDGISRLNKKRYQATENDSTKVHQFSSSSVHKLSDQFELFF